MPVNSLVLSLEDNYMTLSVCVHACVYAWSVCVVCASVEVGKGGLGEFKWVGGCGVCVIWYTTLRSKEELGKVMKVQCKEIQQTVSGCLWWLKHGSFLRVHDQDCFT